MFTFPNEDTLGESGIDVKGAGSGEEMFFFEAAGRRLLGFLHRAAGASLGLVYCPPFGEERNQSHPASARAARALAAAGVAVLRFDFSGCGDSEGDLEDASIEDWLAEIAAAEAALREKAGVARVGFWGLRAGANLAALHASGRADTALLALWHPVPDPRTYMRQYLRQRVATGLAAGASGGAGGPGGEKGESIQGLSARIEAGETIEVMGYPIARKLFASFDSRAAGPDKGEYPFPVGIFAIAEAEEPPQSLKRMADALAARGTAELIHVREEPFWDRYWRWDAAAIARSMAEWVRAKGQA
jgi:exosortase A-associated hydrolase 2